MSLLTASVGSLGISYNMFEWNCLGNNIHSNSKNTYLSLQIHAIACAILQEITPKMLLWLTKMLQEIILIIIWYDSMKEHILRRHTQYNVGIQLLINENTATIDFSINRACQNFQIKRLTCHDQIVTKKYCRRYIVYQNLK